MSIERTIEEAANVVRSGGIVAYPTEAVWGLGCDPFDEGAVHRLLAIKQRPVEKGLIVIAATLDQLRPLIDLAALPTDRLAAVLSTWPGPYTWAMPASEQAPRWITGQHDSIAVRVSQHPVVVGLCNAYGGALVSTSANLGGQPAVTRRDALDPALLARVQAVVEGDTGGLARATPIRDAINGDVLRE
ncbi:L-threonylcarbamoyladenylate synthase [Pseudoxanthomonas putridarboris]|uniref:Threonylcarbamoyl-AMP synthase n=1 Tax=Pseudoxanthomonas putridarboris TaxID=752605 RepID=A0ABU9IVV2_9GAMM